ncbi:hypothetical protein U1872_15255 [Sphingomonas sp. RB3P16]|uniref:hypothetical protein n=1 Tax=Parasphingomonas frigoris TaxID=3096163 RepID=UPI002FCB00F6
MLSTLEQVAINLDSARALRAAGTPYRQIGRQLGLTSGQLGHIRRTLKREKAGLTRLRSTHGDVSMRELSVNRSALPIGLRHGLTASGYRTLGDLADRIADPDLPGFEAMPGIGPYRARLIKNLLDQFGLLAGSADLQAEIEALFPELRA